MADPFREEDADVFYVSDQNPYTIMEGYELEDASGAGIGETEETVYNVVGGVLKYVLVEGHTAPADRIEVNAEQERVRVPYDREAIGSASTVEDPSGEFDRRLSGHYEEPS